MYIICSYGVAVLFCFITMLCWGSWANTQKLATKSWPFQLFYWDYVLGAFFTTLLLALTMGSIGNDGRPFILDFMQGEWYSFLSAFIGGTIFNLSNILLVIAIDVVGMAIAFPVGVGIALVFGVILNYILAPIGSPLLLFSGITSIIFAIILAAISYRRINTQLQDRLTTIKGLIIAIIAGLLMGTFYRFVANSMSMDFISPTIGKYTPYTASVIFTLGILISNFIWNTLAMKNPLKGEKITYSTYFKESNIVTHVIGMLGGTIWSVGTLFSFIAAGMAGYAISYGLGQGATMIAALWGIFVWREFKDADKKTKMFLKFMFIFYLLGLFLIIIARFK